MRFYEETKGGVVTWEAKGHFENEDVHKQVGLQCTKSHAWYMFGEVFTRAVCRSLYIKQCNINLDILNVC